MFYYLLFIRLSIIEKYVRLLDRFMIWAVTYGFLDLATKISQKLYGEGLSKNYLKIMLEGSLDEGNLDRAQRIVKMLEINLDDQQLKMLLLVNLKKGNYENSKKIASLLGRELTADERKKITEVCVEKSRYLSAFEVNAPDPFATSYSVKRVFP